jgi:hypothetical protein
MSLVLLAIPPLVAACVTTKAATKPPAAGPLDVPDVPPRVIALPPEPVETVASEGESDVPTAPRTRPRPRPADRADRREDPPKPAEPAPTAEGSSSSTAEPSTGPPLLRTPATADDGEAERRIKQALGRATRDLSRVNVPTLNGDSKSQYDQARRFMNQAQTALSQQNYTLAASQAEKAEKIARELIAR